MAHAASQTLVIDLDDDTDAVGIEHHDPPTLRMESPESVAADIDVDLRGCICAFCLLEDRRSPLIDVHLDEAINFDNFRLLLSAAQQAELVHLLPPSDRSDTGLRDMFHFLASARGSDERTTLEYFQELLAQGNLDSTVRAKVEAHKAVRLTALELSVWRQADMWTHMPSVIPATEFEAARIEGEHRLRVSKPGRRRTSPVPEAIANYRLLLHSQDLDSPEHGHAFHG
jgi:hypothetical protein